MNDEYCFICSRATFHVAEHDSLVHAGLARYTRGNVVKTDAWDPELARVLTEVEYRHYERDGYSGMDMDEVVREARAAVAA